MPDDEQAQRELLQALDLEGRAAVGRGDYVVAATAFGCLVDADPTPESAGNLAVVLREEKALGDALLMARCAEQLAAPGPARERATARRLDIERRLGLSAPVAAPRLAARVDVDSDQQPTPASPAEARRGWAYAALVMGATALIGSGALYTLARQRAGQFDDEQLANGYSDRARELHDDTQSLEVGSWAAAGFGALLAIAGGALLRF